MRLLFSSVHSYLDPSSGAALCTRELLELLAARGMDCRVFCTEVLDHEQETSVDEVLHPFVARTFLSVYAVAAGQRRSRDHDAHGIKPGRSVASCPLPTTEPVIFPSEYSRRHHARLLGLDGPVIPDPIPLDRIVADNPEPTYATFINPQPSKGMTVFARIALELNRQRPDIPLLIVEGRGTAEALARLPVDLSGLTNPHRMANTPDPRDFYRVSRAVLVPSLWRESPGRVPVEAMANGIPVLASDRGALPETLGNSGFVFTIPERYTPQSLEVPTAREVAPWVAALERLWDDPELESRHRALARAEARRWEPSRIADRTLPMPRRGSGR